MVVRIKATGESRVNNSPVGCWWITWVLRGERIISWWDRSNTNYFWSIFMTLVNLVPRSLVGEAEGEIWPNSICITWSPVRNVTGEASAHAQHKFGAVKADFVAYNKLTTGLRHDLGIFAPISKFHCFHETKRTQNEVERFFRQLGRICSRIHRQQ